MRVSLFALLFALPVASGIAAPMTIALYRIDEAALSQIDAQELASLAMLDPEQVSDRLNPEWSWTLDLPDEGAATRSYQAPDRRIDLRVEGFSNRGSLGVKVEFAEQSQRAADDPRMPPITSTRRFVTQVTLPDSGSLILGGTFATVSRRDGAGSTSISRSGYLYLIGRSESQAGKATGGG